MPGDFSSQFIIGVTLQNLEALQELRRELRALREDASTPIEYKVSVSPKTADNIGKVVEEKVAAGIEKGTKKGRSKAGGSTVSAGAEKVALDAASMQKLNQAAERIEKAAEAMAKALGESRKQPVEVDTSKLAAEIAGAVAKGMGRGPRTRAMSAERQAQLKAERDALDAASVTPKGLKKVTELNSKEVQQLLEKRAELIGGALKKQTSELRRQVEALEEATSIHSTPTRGFGTGGDADAVVYGAQDALDEMRDKIIKTQQQLLEQTAQSLGERSEQLSQQLRAKVEQVTSGVKRGGVRDLNRTINRQTLKLEKAFETVGNRITEQFAQFTNQLADAISRMQIALPQGGGVGGVSGMMNTTDAILEMGSAAPGVAASPKRKRKLKARPAPVVMGGAAPLDDSPERLRQANINIGLRMLEEFRAAEAKRTKSKTSKAVLWENELGRMNEADARRFREDVRQGRLTLTGDDEALFRSAGAPAGRQLARMLREGAARVMLAGGRVPTELGTRIPGAAKLAEVAEERRVAQEQLRRTRRDMREINRQMGLGNNDPALMAREQELRARESDLALRASEAKERHKTLLGTLSGDVGALGGLLPEDISFPAGQSRGRRVSPGKAQRMADAMLRQADELELRDKQGGPFTVTLGQARFLSDRIKKVMPVLHRIEKAKKITPEGRAEYAQLFADPMYQSLLGFAPEDVTFGDVVGLASGLGNTHKRVSHLLGLAGVARADMNLPRFSPLEMKEQANVLRASGKVNEADELMQFRANLVARAAKRGLTFTQYGDPELNAITDAMATKRGKAFGKEVVEEVPEHVREAYQRLIMFGGEWHHGEFQGFTHPVFQPEIRELPAGTPVVTPGFTSAAQYDPSGAYVLKKEKAGAAPVVPPDVERHRLAELVPLLPQRLAEAQAREQRAIADIQRVTQAILTEGRGPDVPIVNGATGATSYRPKNFEAMRQAREDLMAARRLVRERREDMVAIPKRLRDVEAYLAAPQAAAAGEPALELYQISGVHRRSQERLREELAAAAAVHQAAAGGGAGGGGGTVPPAPPGAAGPSGPGGGDWREFAAAMKSLEGMRLTGLADDMQAMANAAKEMKAALGSNLGAALKVGVLKAQESVKVAGNNARLSEIRARREMQAERLEESAKRTEALRQRTEAWVQSMGLWGVGKVSSGVRSAVGGQVAIAAPHLLNAINGDGLDLFGMAKIFQNNESSLGAAQNRFRNLVNRYGVESMLGPNLGPVTNRIRSAAIDQDMLRMSLLQTVEQASARSPKLAQFAPEINAYRTTLHDRLGREALLDAYQQARARATDPTRSVDERRAAARSARMAIAKGMYEYGTQTEAQAAEVIMARKRGEDQVTQAILKRASAQFQAIRASETELTLLDRFGLKLKSFSMYLGAGFLLYGVFGAIKAAVSEVTQLESAMARLQGLSGNGTVTERRALESGLLSASMQYGMPIGQSTQILQSFVQSGLRGPAALAQTRAAMSGVLGAGLDAQQATDLLMTVSNATRDAVSGSDILDRISRVQGSSSVAANQLATAIQRLAPVATQLQPGRVGGYDALDFILGATSTQMRQTRVGGESAASALKMMMSRLVEPNTARLLQGTFGIKLASDVGGTQLRPLMDIFGDIAAKYKALSTGPHANSAIAAQLLTTVGGVRNTAQAAALLGNWDQVMSTMKDSARAWGDTQRRAELQMDTFAYQVDRTKTAFIGFMDVLLRQTGVLSLMKWTANALGSGAANSSSMAGFAPLLGSAAVLGVGTLAARAAKSAMFSKEALAELAATNATKSVVMENTASLLGGLGKYAVGAGEAGLAIAVPLALMATYHKIQQVRQGNKDRYAAPDVDMNKLAQSDLYQGYQQQALRNGMTVPGLQGIVTQKVRDIQAQVLKDSRFRGMGTALFTTDDVTRKHQAGLYDELVKRFTDAIAQAVPEIGKIGDESERTAAALQLLKTTALTQQMVSGYVQSYESQQLSGIQDDVMKRLQDAMGHGVATHRMSIALRGRGFGTIPGEQERQIAERYGFGMTRAAMGGTAGSRDISAVLTSVFGPISGAVLSASMLDVGGTGTVVQKLVRQLNTTSDAMQPLGKAFDQLVESTLKMTDTQQALVDKLMATAKGSDYEERRSHVIDALGKLGTPEAAMALRKLRNEQSLEASFADVLATEFPGLKGQNSGPQQTGGLEGTSEVMRVFRLAADQRIRALQKMGMTGAAAEVQAMLNALNDPGNRTAHTMTILQQYAKGRGTARDRLLDVILRYDQAESGTRQAGGALRGVGVGVDIAGESLTNAENFVRGLYEAKSQTRGDLLRAISKYVATGDLEALAKKQAGVINLDGDVSPLEQEGRVTKGAGLIMRGLARMNPGEKQALSDRVREERGAYSALMEDKALFAKFGPDDQQTIRDMVTGDLGHVLGRVLLDWQHLEKIGEKIVKIREQELATELSAEQNLKLRNAAAMQALTGRNATAAMVRGLGIRRMEGLAGPGAALGLQLSDISLGAQEEIARLNLELRQQVAEAEQQRKKVGDVQTNLQIDAARATNLQDIAKVNADAVRRAQQARGEYAIQVAENARNFRISAAQAGGGADDVIRARLAGLTPGTLEYTQAIQAYQLDYLQRQKTIREGMMGGMTRGFVGATTSYETFKGPAVLPRIYKPALDTISGRISESFANNLFGPDGLLGEKMKGMFNSNVFMEAQMIRNAHIAGIVEGFARTGLYGAPASSIDWNALAANGPISASTLQFAATTNFAAIGTGQAHAGGPGSVLPNVSGDIVLKSSTAQGRQDLLHTLGVQAAFMAGNLGGGYLGRKTGVRNGQNYGSEGAQAGASLGMLIGSMTPLGPLGGAIGSAAGGLLGGWIGGRFGKRPQTPEFMALERIDRNTRETVTAVVNQTRQLLNLEARLLNVPASFKVPAYAIAAGGGAPGGTAASSEAALPPIIITVNESANAHLTAQNVVSQLRTELRGRGSYISPRGTRN